MRVPLEHGVLIRMLNDPLEPISNLEAMFQAWHPNSNHTENWINLVGCNIISDTREVGTQFFQPDKTMNQYQQEPGLMPLLKLMCMKESLILFAGVRIWHSLVKLKC